MGLPQISAKGFPTNLVEWYLAGIIPRAFNYILLRAKGQGRNNFLKLALRFRSNLFDLKIQNRRNSRTYFEGFVLEDRAKMA